MHPATSYIYILCSFGAGHSHWPARAGRPPVSCCSRPSEQGLVSASKVVSPRPASPRARLGLFYAHTHHPSHLPQLLFC
ncbi:hypothetical protein BT67DRAFT_444310 [Trichocladium antarcticum]|uniref:Uncharacterized protein n=1 Tax=Trichocladium antarcticum TaxID=1450529 RepID=A0AAN6UFR6_9PEZI|nr:hypothetical protein BT67DRAFT_444310 [Trichocladium antarcticum]